MKLIGFPLLHQTVYMLRHMPLMLNVDCIKQLFASEDIFDMLSEYFSSNTTVIGNEYTITIYCSKSVVVGYWLNTKKINKIVIKDDTDSHHVLKYITHFDAVSEEYIKAAFDYMNLHPETLKHVEMFMHLNSSRIQHISENTNKSIYHEKVNGEISYLQVILGDTVLRAGKYYSDDVVNTYYEQRLSEMAVRISSENEVNPLHSSKESRMTNYITSRNDPIYVSLSDHIRLHKTSSGGGETSYMTLDHGSREALHKTIINTHEAGDRLPFKHETQDTVEKVDHPTLPKGYATDLLYSHFLQSKHPLSSSDQQHIGGHKMWENITHRALDDGHHAYLWNNRNSTLNHLKSHDAIDKGLRHYYSTTEPRTMDFGHMIISKTNLEEQK